LTQSPTSRGSASDWLFASQPHYPKWIYIWGILPRLTSNRGQPSIGIFTSNHHRS
jgi:hypothetical protein